MKNISLIIGIMLLSGSFIPQTAASEEVEIANPASVYCVQLGYTLEIRISDNGGEYGVCVYPDGNECEEWAFFRNECGAGYRNLPDVESKERTTPEED